MKNIQIPEELFVQLCYYHLFEDRDHAEDIAKGLENKLEAMARRDLYGKYKQGDEKARREYLDRIGVPESFRW